MKKIKITQIKSGIDRPKRQKDTLLALGIRKMHQSVIKDDNAQVWGMVKTVHHLVRIEQA